MTNTFAVPDETTSSSASEMPRTYAVPDETTVTSSAASVASDEAETVVPAGLKSPERAPVTFSDLPPEIKLRIFRYLDSPSEITALNGTTRILRHIWKENTAAISTAVLSRSIEQYDKVLELFEISERVKQIHAIAVTLPASAVLTRIKLAQRHALEVVRKGRRKDLQDQISRMTLNRNTLWRNNQLICAANNAARLHRLIETRVVYDGGSLLPDLLLHPITRPNALQAFTNLTILRRLKVPEAMAARVKTMSRSEISALLFLTKYLIYNCPDWHKIRLGISQRILTYDALPWDWRLEEASLGSRPRCYLSPSARRAFYVVAERTRERGVRDFLRGNKHGCRGGCERRGGGTEMGEVQERLMEM
ncbi:hypothetical protein BDR22DRAFT_827068 [Usnea florida]